MQNQQPQPYYSPPQPNQPYPQQQPYMPQQQPGMGGAEFMNIANSFVMNQSTWEAVGTQALSVGQTYIGQQYKQISTYKAYFHINHQYVLNKLKLLLFSFTQKQWNRLPNRSEMDGQPEGYKTPKQDPNAPDLYIPLMSYVTYVILVGAQMGLASKFKPEVLTITSTTALAVTLLQVLVLRLGFYLLNVEHPVKMMDLLCYAGYQFVLIDFIQVLVLFQFNSLAVFAALIYAILTFGLFIMRSLRYLILPGGDSMANPTQGHIRQRRRFFLFFYVCLQSFCIWLLVK